MYSVGLLTVYNHVLLEFCWNTIQELNGIVTLSAEMYECYSNKMQI